MAGITSILKKVRAPITFVSVWVRHFVKRVISRAPDDEKSIRHARQEEKKRQKEIRRKLRMKEAA